MSGEKHLFLWRPPGSIHELARTFRRSLAPLRAAGEVTVHVTEEPPPRISVVPFRRRPVALVSLRGEMARALEPLSALPGSIEGWRVTESVPIERARGARAAVALLTIFRQHPHLTRDAFFREWFGTHTPMSLEIHPMTGYVRNVIEDAVLEGSARWDGIVTEDFADRAHLVSARHLFGGVRRMVPNMIRVGLHVSSFIDMRSIETYLVREHTL